MQWTNVTKVLVISKAVSANGFKDFLQYLHYNENIVDLSCFHNSFNKLSNSNRLYVFFVANSNS